MSVKMIFKSLIGTILLIVVSALVIEIINLQVSAIEINQMTKVACRQSAVLFSQETYKPRDSGGGMRPMQDAITADGSSYVDGDFYSGKSPEAIYRQMYTSSDFKSWLTSGIPYYTNSSTSPSSSKPIDIWNSVRVIDIGLQMDATGAIPVMPTNIMSSNYEEQLKDYTDKVIGKSYVDVMMTPLNMGVPYLDKDVLQDIFRWNLAQIASECNSAQIRNDDSGNPCVFYDGFRIYADQAKIDNISYRVYDTYQSGGSEAFEYMTHIESDKLGFDDSKIKYLGTEDNKDERRRICVVGIDYSVPVGYQGVTPIKNIFNFAVNQHVEGFNNGDDKQDLNIQGTTWNDASATLSSGGFGEGSYPPGVLPTSGKLIYYVVR